MHHVLRRVRILAVVVALAFLAPALLASTADDAGLGRDASDRRNWPSPIAFASFDGAFDRAGDQDWYVRVGSPYGDDAVCVEAAARGAAGDVELAAWDLRDERAHGISVSGAFTPEQGFRAGVAVPDLDLARLGFAPVDGVGAYTFEWRAYRHADLGSGDAGAGDADDLVATARPLTRPCNSGTLDAGDVDTFVMYANAGEDLVLSAVVTGASAVEVVLADATGRVLAAGGAETFANVAAPATGFYYLSFRSAAPTSAPYLFALAVGDPGSTPCRPACLQS